MQLLIGSDPELFVQQNNIFKSAHGLIKGDKDNPHPVKDGAVQVDGMALEFNTNPASTEEEFVHNIHSVVSQLKAMVPEYHILAVPVAHFTEEYLKSQPQEATELGCNPDYNAWTSKENIRPDGTVNFRTGAGHIHIGWTKGEDLNSLLHRGQCEIAVKQLDVFLGIPSVLFDSSSERRELYGKAGAYRPKSYGVEYRVLSNVWVGSEVLTRWVYRTAIKAIEELEKGNMLFDKIPNIQNIINSSDAEAALVVCKEFGLEVPEV